MMQLIGSPVALTRIAKLLELTASPHDGEALAAIRKANELLQGLGGTWTKLIAERSLAPQDASDTAPVWPPTMACKSFQPSRSASDPVYSPPISAHMLDLLKWAVN